MCGKREVCERPELQPVLSTGNTDGSADTNDCPNTDDGTNQYTNPRADGRTDSNPGADECPDSNTGTDYSTSSNGGPTPYSDATTNGCTGLPTELHANQSADGYTDTKNLYGDGKV